ncbi:mucin-5AC isoform X2 [Oncorhynchus kisutch]|uniref:Adhesion G-protein coupled receptor G2 n=1 Tax=Oncorhynchus kisutch TaxID=8019 RepID=A0A8C7KVV6_ONCKI|nr:mucin-5AC isoform X2 [Oncorhynchus kisutch]
MFCGDEDNPDKAPAMWCGGVRCVCMRCFTRTMDRASDLQHMGTRRHPTLLRIFLLVLLLHVARGDATTETSQPPPFSPSPSSLPPHVLVPPFSAPPSSTSTPPRAPLITNTISTTQTTTTSVSTTQNTVASIMPPSSITSTSAIATTPAAPSAIATTPAAPSAIATTPAAPSAITTTPAAPSAIATTPAAPSAIATTPAAPSAIATTPAAPSAITTTPAAPSAIATTPAAPSAITTAPAAPSAITTTPAAPSAITTTPAAPSAITTTPAAPSAITTTPASPSAITTTPAAPSAITTTPAAPSAILFTATLPTTDISSSNTPNTSTISVPMSNASSTPPPTSLTTLHPSPLHTASSNMTNEPMTSTMPSPSTILHSTSPIITSTTNMTSKNATSPGPSTPLPITVTSNATTAAYYWMVLAVDVTGDLKNESDISGWFRALFHSLLDSCEPSNPEQANGTNSTDTLQTTSVSPTYPTPYNMTTWLYNFTTTTLSQNFTNFTTATPSQNFTNFTTTTLSQNFTNFTTTTLSQNFTNFNMTTRSQDFTNFNMTTLSQNFTNFNMTTLTTNMTTMLYNSTPPHNRSMSVPPYNHSMTTLSPSWPHSTTSEEHEGGNMTAASLFQDIEVTCVNKTGIRRTNCTVLLRTRKPTFPCCFQRALWLGQENSSIQTHIVGNRVERVGKGLCAGQLPPSNGFAKCTGFLNGTLPLPNTCHAPGPVNISCGHAGTVYVPLGNQTQMDCGMPPKPPIDVEIVCNCSSYCYGTAAYYTLGIQIKDPAMNISKIFYMIDQLKTPPPCNNTSETHPPCPLPIISTIYQDAHVECDGANTNLQSCRVIVRLNHSVPICAVSTALMTVFNDEHGIGYNGTVTRAAICGYPGSSGGLLNSTFTWESINLNTTLFCEAEKTTSIVSCKQGENVCVLLNEMCDPMPPSTSPSPMANTTLPATTILPPPPNVTIHLNSPYVPLNTTLAPLNTTSKAPNTTPSAPNTTPSATNTTPSATNTTPSAPNTTIAMTTRGNTTTNSSTPIIPPVNPTTASPKYTTTALTTTTSAPNTTAASSEEQANQLLDLTSNVSKLNSSQVDQLVSQLEALLAGPNVSLDLGKTSVKIVSNLLGASSDTLASSSTKIIGIVDTVGLKLVVQQEATILTKSVAVAIKTVDGTNFQQTSFSIPDPNNVQIRGDGRARRSVRTEASSLPQGSVTFPSSLTANLSHEQQLQASRLQFNFYQKATVFQDRALGDSRLYSGILGASVANLSIKSLQKDVVITLRNTEPVPANVVVSCVFWDFGLNDGSGGWNRKGCSVRNSTENETVCACNHLTSFGVLLDISRTGITNHLQATILTYITYIGCGISAIFLSVTLLTYLAFGKLRKDIPSKILIQLCMALLFLNLVFLVDAWLALYPDAVGLCISTAWFLHYFLLASFTWMGLEAVHMYLALVKVFNTYIKRYMLKFSLVGWGVPLLVVIVVIAVDKNNYGLVSYGKYSDNSPTDDFCWLKNNIAFYVSVVAYFCVIFVLNLSMFVVVMVQLCRIKSQNPHNMRHRNGLQDLRSVVGITLLLGLTWGFAFFAWGPVNLAFMYLFAIFNSFQGFFIFVFHCAVKENVRRQWRTYLCCGRLRLAENSDWSRTATQKTEKKSLSVTRATSFRSGNSSQFNHTSSSSFLTGDSPERPSGATGSLFDDRTITALEELNSDVVLNEVNSQFRTQSQRAA